MNPDLRARTAANLLSLGKEKESPMDEHRCAVVERGRIGGQVLEFGPGPGTNFKCFPQKSDSNSTATAGTSIEKYTGVDPNGYFREMPTEEMNRLDLQFPIDFVGLKGGRFGYLRRRRRIL